jgi:hypothetical protein
MEARVGIGRFCGEPDPRLNHSAAVTSLNAARQKCYRNGHRKSSEQSVTRTYFFQPIQTPLVPVLVPVFAPSLGLVLHPKRSVANPRLAREVHVERAGRGQRELKLNGARAAVSIQTGEVWLFGLKEAAGYRFFLIETLIRRSRTHKRGRRILDFNCRSALMSR